MLIPSMALIGLAMSPARRRFVIGMAADEGTVHVHADGTQQKHKVQGEQK